MSDLLKPSAIFAVWNQKSLRKMYGIYPEELNDFAIDCCYQQIGGCMAIEVWKCYASTEQWVFEKI
jgi:hypothetical protein